MKKLYFLQKQMPRVTKSRLVIIECSVRGIYFLTVVLAATILLKYLISVFCNLWTNRRRFVPSGEVGVGEVLGTGEILSSSL